MSAERSIGRVGARRGVSAPLPVEPSALVEVDLFRGLDSADVTRLATLLRRQVFRAGAQVMAVDQPGEVAYVILEGAVKIYVDQEDGSEVVLAILGPGEIVGEMSVVDTLGRSATVVALEESTLAWMDRRNFWECLRTMPVVTFNLTGILSRRLRLANAHIEALATLDVYGRVARQLLAFAQEYGQADTDGDVVIPIRLTQSDLAGLVGASRVRVNQVLVAYKRRRSISVDQNYHITVHDQEALAARCR